MKKCKHMAKAEECKECTPPEAKEENKKQIDEQPSDEMKKGMSFNELRAYEQSKALKKSEDLVKSKMDALMKTGNKELIKKTLEKIKGLQ